MRVSGFLVWMIALCPAFTFGQEVLSVKVYHRELFDFIEGATVVFDYGEGDKDMETNTEGICKFPRTTDIRLSPGQEVKITVYKKGYQTRDTAYTVKKDKVDRLLINMKKTATISVTGQVLENGPPDEVIPIPGVEVVYQGDFTTTTKIDGTFRLDIPLNTIDDLGNNDLVFTLLKEGYKTGLEEEKLGRKENRVHLGIVRMTKEGQEPAFPYETLRLPYNQAWTAENLDVETFNSFCYEKNPDYCELYGRLYTWEDAKAACESLEDGWRLPDEQDWERLTFEIGEGFGSKGPGSGNRGDPIKSLEKMKINGWAPAMGGYRTEKGKFKDRGAEGIGLYWSATPTPLNERFEAIAFGFSEGAGVMKTSEDKRLGLSCRCVKD